MRARAVALALLASVTACASTPTLSCVTDDSAICSPLYTPTFDSIFARTLKPKCALNGANCHASEGAQAGLVLDDEARAYALLLGASAANGGDGRARVTPGGVSCSVLIERIASTDPGLQMPRGLALDASERCGIEQWVAAGAKR